MEYLNNLQKVHIQKSIEGADQKQLAMIEGEYQLACKLVTGTLPEVAGIELNIDLTKSITNEEYMPCRPSQKKTAAPTRD